MADRITGRLGIFVLIFGATVCSSASAEVHRGKVVLAGDGKLVISDVDDANEMFAVADDARITRNGKDASLSDLVAGDSVVVTAKRVDGKLVAGRRHAKLVPGRTPPVTISPQSY